MGTTLQRYLQSLVLPSFLGLQILQRLISSTDLADYLFSAAARGNDAVS